MLLLHMSSSKTSGIYFSSVDQEQLDKEINNLRKGLKAKVNRLNEMQGMMSVLAVGETSPSLNV